MAPWRELPEDVKEWDRKAVKDFPNVLAKAGLKIVKVKAPKRNGRRP